MLSRKDKQWIEFCIEGARIFSTCAKRQFHCVIVNPQQVIVGQGYNGVPSGMLHCIDGGCPRYINNVPSGTPYDHGEGLCYSAHAEQNALARGEPLEYSSSTLYVNGLPCLTCAKMIASAGIPRIVVLHEDERIDWSVTEDLLRNKAGVEVTVVR